MNTLMHSRISINAAFPRRGPRWPSPLLEDTHLSWRWPADGKVRVRKLLSRAAMRPIFRLPSVKLGRDVQLESQLEHDIALLLDACPTVNTFAEQPVEMTMRTPNGDARHVPDFAVFHSGQPCLLEAKFSSDVDASVLARTEHLTHALNRLGIGYRLVTERDLPSTVRLGNARILLKRGRTASDPLASMLLLDRARRGAVQLGELGWEEPAQSALIARHVLEGQLHVDLSAPLTAASPVSVDGHEEGWLWA